MKKFFLLIICPVLFSCNSNRPVILPPAEYREKVVERPVPYPVPGDSTQFYALLACDSLNNVILKEFSEYKSGRIESRFSLRQNMLSYNTYRPPDTVYVMAKDSIRIENIPYKVEVPVEVNKLTRYQSFQVKAAVAAELLILGWLASKLNWKNIIKSITNIFKFK